MKFVIGGTHLKFFKRCWVRGIEYLLGNIIKNLGTKIQVFGVVLSFIALVIFVIQFIIGDDETKQRKKKTIIYTVIGLVLLILVPSIINFIIDTVK